MVMDNIQKQKENMIEHFKERSMKYDSASLWVKNKAILNEMMRFLPVDNRKYKVLDLGAGTGAVSKFIIKNYKDDIEVTAVDCCLAMLEKIDEPQIQIVEADVADLPFPEQNFDIVISRQCLHYVTNLNRVLSEIRRVLKPDGIFILGQIVPYDSRTAQYWKEVVRIRQPLRKWYFTAEQWNEKLMQNDFKIVQTSNCVHKGSVDAWIEKYNITNQSLIDKYKKMLLEADNYYREIYSVQERGEDITYNAYWHIVKCALL